MIADMIINTLSSNDRKLNISLVFIPQSYFKVPKDVRLNSTHSFVIKITNKRQLQHAASDHSSDIHFKDFINIYKNVLLNHILFLVNDTTLLSDNPLRYRKNLLN